jgi:hypothetical protein
MRDHHTNLANEYNGAADQHDELAHLAESRADFASAKCQKALAAHHRAAAKCHSALADANGTKAAKSIDAVEHFFSKYMGVDPSVGLLGGSAPPFTEDRSPSGGL